MFDKLLPINYDFTRNTNTIRAWYIYILNYYNYKSKVWAGWSDEASNCEVAVARIEYSYMPCSGYSGFGIFNSYFSPALQTTHTVYVFKDLMIIWLITLFSIKGIGTGDR